MELIQLPHMEYEDNPQVKVLLESSEMPQLKSRMIMEQFSGFLKQAEEMEKVIDQYIVTDVTEIDKMEKAKNAAKALQRIRIDAEDLRVELKKQSLNEGRLIDGVNKVILGLISPMEDKMKASARFIEMAEKKAKDELRKKREDMLSPYTTEAAVMPLAEMSEEGFNQLYESLKAGHQKRLDDQAKAERDKKEAEERLAKENEAFKLYIDRVAKLTNLGAIVSTRDISLVNKLSGFVSVMPDELRAMNEETFENCLYVFEQAKKDNDEVLLAEKKKQEKERIANEAKLMKERQEKHALQKAENERIEKEAQAKRYEVNAKRRAERAPDKIKVQSAIDLINQTKDTISKIKLTTAEAKKILTDADQLLGKTVAFTEKGLKSLED